MLALSCLQMLVNPKIQEVYHEYEEFIPADDVIIVEDSLVDCLQCKHTLDPHGLLDIKDLTEQTPLRLHLSRMSQVWLKLLPLNKKVRIRIVTPLAAGPTLAKLLDGHEIASSVIANTAQKKLRSVLQKVAGIQDELQFKGFLQSLWFDLRFHNDQQLELEIKDTWIAKRLGLDSDKAYQHLMMAAESWWLEIKSRPIRRDEVRSALQIDQSSLPQVFPVDSKLYVASPDFSKQLERTINSLVSGYCAVIGPPGSGKSTFLARFINSYERKKKCGVIRYFCFTEVNELQFERRATKVDFLKSMIEQLWDQYGSFLPGERRYEYSQEQLIKLLTALGKHFRSQNTFLLTVVDGLDHVRRAQIDESHKLLQALPTQLPDGVVCLVSAQGTQYLPPLIKNQCKGDRLLTMPLFTAQQTAEFITKHKAITNPTRKVLKLLFEKTEGLPLYLHYVAGRLTGISAKDIESTIQELPAHSGHIDAYYERLWLEFGAEDTLRRVCGLFARLRFSVSRENLYALANLDAFTGRSALDRLRHLLRETAAASRLFHNSFRDFVLSQLTADELKQLDTTIVNFLKKDRFSNAWFAHWFRYAEGAGYYDQTITEIGHEFIETAICKGRPASEIKETLLRGVDASTVLQDSVSLARISTLLAQTSVRLEYRIDPRQLIRSLLTVDEHAGALNATEGLGGAALVDVIFDFYERGHAGTATELASKYLARLRTVPDDVSTVIAIGELIAGFGHAPARTLASWITSLRDHTLPTRYSEKSGVVLLTNALKRLYQFKRWEELRVLKRLLLGKKGSATWQDEWITVEAELQSAHNSPKALQYIAKHAGKEKDPSCRIRIAALAARLGATRATVKQLLGKATYTPSTDNESALRSSPTMSFRLLRDYALTLSYVDARQELDALRDRLAAYPTSLPIYQLASVAAAVTESSLIRKVSVTPQEVLAPLETLAKHDASRGERIYEAYRAIRMDLANLSELVFDSYEKIEGDPVQLAACLATLQKADISTTHQGIGIAIADFDSQISLLFRAATFPTIRPHLDKLVEELYQLVKVRTLETATRCQHFLYLSELSATIGDKERARRWLSEGIRASAGYGDRKDITLSLLIDGAVLVNRVEPSKANERFAIIGDWVDWMSTLTDGKETKWFFHHLFEAVLKHNFDLASLFLLHYQQHVGDWKYRDCIAKYIEAYTGNQTELAYALTELISVRIGYDERDKKLAARLALLSLLSKRHDAPHFSALARKIATYLVTEVAPERRASGIDEFNSLVSAFPEAGVSTLLPGIPWPKQKSDLLDKEIKLDGVTKTPDEIYELMSGSVADFEKGYALLSANFVTDREVGVAKAMSRLLKKTKSQSDLDQLLSILRKDTLLPHELLIAAGDLYLGFGNHQKHRDCYWESFCSSHSYGMWDKKVEYLAPLLKHSKQETKKLLHEFIRERVHHLADYGHGVSTLMIRAVMEAGLEADSVGIQIYNDFHESVGYLLSQLPEKETHFNWLLSGSPAYQPFEQVVWTLLKKDWATPMIPMRVALTHRVRELCQSHAQFVIPRLARLLTDEDYTQRGLAALVIDALSIDDPHSLTTVVPQLIDALRQPHAITSRHLRDAITRISQIAPLSDDLETSLQALFPVIRKPPQFMHIAPSAAWENYTRIYVPPSAHQALDTLSEFLGIHESILRTKVERKMIENGFVLKKAYSTDQEVFEQYVSPSRDSAIPHELPTESRFRSALAQVLEGIVRSSSFDEERVNACYRVLRFYDPALPWNRITAKPAELALPVWKATTESMPPNHIADWLNDSPVVKSSTVLPDDGWITVWELQNHTLGDLAETEISLTYLISSVAAEGYLSGVVSLPDPQPVMQLAPDGNFTTLSINEAQLLLEQCSFPEDPGSDPFIPLVGLHKSAWWNWESNYSAGLLGFWQTFLGLKYASPLSLDMNCNFVPAVTLEHWRDGFRTDDYDHRTAGKGVRLRLASGYLKKLLAHYNLRLLTTTSRDRWVVPRKYGTKIKSTPVKRDFAYVGSFNM